MLKVGGSEVAVSDRICAAWIKFRKLSTKGTSNHLKGVLYQSCVRPGMTYEEEIWATKVEAPRCMCTTKMMCGTKIDESRGNDEIISMIGVERIEERVERHRLILWFGHVMQQSEKSQPRQTMSSGIHGETRVEDLRKHG